MFKQSVRKFGKQVLQWSNVKLAYQRITLTKFTTFFFFLALINCIALVIFQSISFADNAEAYDIISGFLTQANITKNRIVYLSGDVLLECKDIPTESDADCSPLLPSGGNSRRGLDDFIGASTIVQRHSSDKAKTMKDSNGEIDELMLDNGQILDQTCLQSVLWLEDIIHDSMAEDLFTLVFQIWLFLLSFVTILNESLPHLGAAIKLHYHYQDLIVDQACDNVDFLGNWWDARTDHSIPILVFNAVACITTTYIASRLYKAYANQSFNRVDATSPVHKTYKLVLVLSVCVQLGGFFAIASTAMWLDKASFKSIEHVATHLDLYRVVFSVMAALEVPWAILGWICFRRESRWQFLVFFGISLLLCASSSGVFASPLYMFIFHTWPFFASLTVVAYVLIVFTSIMGVFCRLQFGKGLPEFLQQKEVPEGADFAPVFAKTSARTLQLPDQAHKVFSILRHKSGHCEAFLYPSPTPEYPFRGVSCLSVSSAAYSI
ncbi:hypothetical protein BT96DRAFT_282076 [Gymnopus androsaceus JB14]|uniref:Uncharacterized protein n=1 Tax=Gymnopus androsaceus JB14 TaxID=1447944 RepID=A0A6A4I5Z7_9AGAR|nr:hypothetical protein BT96DRAFT_282076 [Gymnopus androsaceus JB14]